MHVKSKHLRMHAKSNKDDPIDNQSSRAEAAQLFAALACKRRGQSFFDHSCINRSEGTHDLVLILGNGGAVRSNAMTILQNSKFTPCSANGPKTFSWDAIDRLVEQINKEAALHSAMARRSCNLLSNNKPIQDVALAAA